MKIMWRDFKQIRSSRFREIQKSANGLVRNYWGGREVGILHLDSEMRWPIPAMGVKFSNPPLDLGLKYHDLSPTLILTADHSPLLFLPGVFYKIKNFFFFWGWTSTWIRTHICMTLPLLTAHFSQPLPFLQSQKVVTLPLFPSPLPLANFWQVPKSLNFEWSCTYTENTPKLFYVASKYDINQHSELLVNNLSHL